MSTKHLRAVLETGIEAAQKHQVGPDAARIMDAARRELEAIEKAARAVAALHPPPPPYTFVGETAGQFFRDIAPLLAIAKEAP